MLHDGGQALQPHAGIHAGRGQGLDGAIGLHVELHEHVVPDFNVAVAIRIGAAGGAARHVFAVVVEDFRARTARAGVGHHPKVVGLVLATLVVANAHHALGRQADDFCPDVIRLVVVDIDGGPKLVGWQLVDLGEQLPRPHQCIVLEIVTKAPVAQHFKKGVVARGVAHVFQVVVLAARTQTGLYGGGAHVRALVRAQKHVLELHHAGIGEHQRGVVARYQRAGGDHRVAFGGKEIKKSLANVGNIHGRGRRRRGRCHGNSIRGQKTSLALSNTALNASKLASFGV